MGYLNKNDKRGEKVFLPKNEADFMRTSQIKENNCM